MLPRAMSGRSREFAQVPGLRIPLPDGLGPERPAIHIVLQVVADNVGLLQEEAHGVRKAEVGGELVRVDAEGPHTLALAQDLRLFFASRNKDPREALADQARDHVAIPVVRCLVDGALPQIRRYVLGHAVAHLLGDVANHFLRPVGQRKEDTRDGAELFRQGLLVAATDAPDAAVRVRQPLRGKLMQLLLLVFLPALVGLHVVFDRVQGPQHQVEDADVHTKAGLELPDDGGEGTGDLAEHVVAERDVGAVGCGLFHVVLQQPAELEAQRCGDL
mmetsp:Transcript_126743/g.354884  ORF Transcript_126743/g.354884 Transcript_126743/m.354884 type:complete len:274 (-) Transcript_126743:1128-1949(-)